MQLKQVIKKILPRKFFDSVKEVVYPGKINILEDRLSSLFLTHYQSIAASSLSQKTVFRSAEFKVYSKHGGDGMLAYIFSKIGVTNCVFVELGVEDGRECNTANLSRNFGWQGLMIDANAEWVKSAKEFYKDYKVEIVSNFVTAENINELIKNNNIKGEIDLLSIDIDGNDYWVWQAIDIVNPRVVVLEYNSAFEYRSLTIKYDPEHRFRPRQEHPLYFGASLAALAKLSKDKGYILVACDVHGHDAFFVRSDIAKGEFIELSPKKAFYPNPHSLKKFGPIEKQFEQMKDFEFKEI